MMKWSADKWIFNMAFLIALVVLTMLKLAGYGIPVVWVLSPIWIMILFAVLCTIALIILLK